MSNTPHSEAEKIAREIVSKHSGHHMQSTISWVDRPQLVTAITSALISAEQRGAQREDWLTIESAPKDGTPIDLWHREYGRVTDTWWDDEDKFWVSSIDLQEGFSHWMKVTPPKEVAA